MAWIDHFNNRHRAGFSSEQQFVMKDRASIVGMRSRAPNVLLAIVLLVLLLLLPYQLWLSYCEEIRTAGIVTRNIAATFENQLDGILRRTDADLIALSSEISRDGLNIRPGSRYRHEIKARLDNRLVNADRTVGLYVHDANGEVLYSSRALPARLHEVSGAPLFRQLRDDPRAGLAFSRMSNPHAPGEEMLVVARALRDEDGKFMGTISSSLSQEYFSTQFRPLDVGKQGIIVLRRSDNHSLLVLWPDVPDGEKGALGRGHPVVERLEIGGEGETIQYTSSIDRIERIASLKSMQAYPLYIVVGLARSEVLAGWHRQVAVVGLSVLMVVGLIFALLLRLGRMRVREADILTDLAQSESQFTALAQLVPVGICRFDKQGKCVFVNDRCMTITGGTRDELLGSRWLDFVHPDDCSKVTAAWVQKDEWRSVRSCEYRIVRSSGELVHVIGEAKAEMDAAGQFAGYIVAQTDITPRKNTEAELLLAKQQAEQANLAKTRFLAAASHDLRQPIQAINLFKDALGRTGLSEEQKSIARLLSMSVHSLSELLYSLLDISRLDAGMVKPRQEAVEVEYLFKAIDDEFSTLARQRNLRFKFFYPSRGMTLVTDPGLLLSVLRNLIDNAFKYTVEGGVLVAVRKRNGRGVIQVWDTGIGIDPRYGERIFDECFQVGNPMQDRSKGLGIGLSIARRTARLLNGDVTFRSLQGRGTVFEINLPLSDDGESEECQFARAQHSPRPYAEIDSSSFGGWRISVIEDDPVVAKSIELSLQALDMQVDVFGSAEEALVAPSLLESDFYISDFILPGMNGIQLLDAIRARSAIPVKAVLMTGETSPERIKVIESSGWRILFKPADLSRLLAFMEEIAAEAH